MGLSMGISKQIDLHLNQTLPTSVTGGILPKKSLHSRTLSRPVNLNPSNTNQVNEKKLLKSSESRSLILDVSM